MYVVTGHLACYDVNLVLYGNLSQHIAGADGHLTRQYSFPIFRNPYQVGFEIRLGMGSKFIKSHSDIYNLFFASRRGVSTIPERDTN